MFAKEETNVFTETINDAGTLFQVFKCARNFSFSELSPVQTTSSREEVVDPCLSLRRARPVEVRVSFKFADLTVVRSLYKFRAFTFQVLFTGHLPNDFPDGSMIALSNVNPKTPPLVLPDPKFVGT